MDFLMITYIRTHFPAVMALALVVASTLAQEGYWSPSNRTLILVNAVLAALGLGVLHYRTLNRGN
jgi:hypothetical protein